MQNVKLAKEKEAKYVKNNAQGKGKKEEKKKRMDEDGVQNRRYCKNQKTTSLWQ